MLYLKLPKSDFFIDLYKQVNYTEIGKNWKIYTEIGKAIFKGKI